MDTELAAALMAAVTGGAVLVAGVTQALKALLPSTWQHGRAPMVLAAALSAVYVVAALAQLGLPVEPATFVGAVAAWLNVYGGAVATHQTGQKVSRIASGATDPAGPDEGAP